MATQRRSQGTCTNTLVHRTVGIGSTSAVPAPIYNVNFDRTLVTCQIPFRRLLLLRPDYSNERHHEKILFFSRLAQISWFHRDSPHD